MAIASALPELVDIISKPLGLPGWLLTAVILVSVQGYAGFLFLATTLVKVPLYCSSMCMDTLGKDLPKAYKCSIKFVRSA